MIDLEIARKYGIPETTSKRWGKVGRVVDAIRFGGRSLREKHIIAPEIGEEPDGPIIGYLTGGLHDNDASRFILQTVIGAVTETAGTYPPIQGPLSDEPAVTDQARELMKTYSYVEAVWSHPGYPEGKAQTLGHIILDQWNDARISLDDQPSLQHLVGTAEFHPIEEA